MVKMLIRNSKRNENKKIIISANKKSKAMWEIINNSLNKKKKSKKTIVTKLKLSNNEVTKDNVTITNKFNEYFTNVGRSMAEKIPHTPHIIHSPRICNSIAFTETDCHEIDSIINKLSSKKSIIDNDIPTSFLKKAAPIVSPILSIVFNSCLKNGIYPNILKVAQVIPL